uniref:Uncharacterized protein n=1 Tax=Knipowitschia caucasica TaxID=637954 RepID=A0AAV2KQQ0_KNICA
MNHASGAEREEEEKTVYKSNKRGGQECEEMEGSCSQQKDPLPLDLILFVNPQLVTVSEPAVFAARSAATSS